METQRELSLEEQIRELGRMIGYGGALKFLGWGWLAGAALTSSFWLALLGLVTLTAGYLLKPTHRGEGERQLTFYCVNCAGEWRATTRPTHCAWCGGTDLSTDVRNEGGDGWDPTLS